MGKIIPGLMPAERIVKGHRSIQRVDARTAASNDEIRIPLKRESVIAEHRILIGVSQAFSVNPTAVDYGAFVDAIYLETGDGRRIAMNGQQAVTLGEFTEDGVSASSTLGATSTASFGIELHHENDGALYDVMAALVADTLSTLDLVIRFAPQTRGFIGGTASGAAAFTVTTESINYPDLRAAVDVIGKLSHFVATLTKSGTTTGTGEPLALQTRNATRFLVLHTLDTSGAVPLLANGVIGNVRLVINGREYRNTTFAAIQADNAAERAYAETGAAVIDFGDDPDGWLDLYQATEAFVEYDILATAPASWRVTLAQDYSVASVA